MLELLDLILLEDEQAALLKKFNDTGLLPFQTLVTSTPIDLVKLSLLNSSIDAQCKTLTPLQEKWKQLWEKCGPEGHPYHPVPGIHTFDLIKSIWLVWEYKREKKENNNTLSNKALAYLFHAIKGKSYSAFYHLVIELMTLLETKNQIELHSQQLLNIALSASKYHLTPGLLLLLKVLFFLANHKSTSEPLKVYYLKHSLNVSILAEKRLPMSELYMDNAFSGMTAEKICSFSTLNFEFSTFKESRKYIYNLMSAQPVAAAQTDFDKAFNKDVETLTEEINNLSVL